MSGDASGAQGVYAQTGGSLTDTASDSPLFHVTNSTGVIRLSGVRTAKATVLALDPTSTWSVTTNSHLTTLTGALVSGSTITNVKGNGHTVSYDANASANSYLGGRTYTLTGGGTLSPA